MLDAQEDCGVPGESWVLLSHAALSHISPRFVCLPPVGALRTINDSRERARTKERAIRWEKLFTRAKGDAPRVDDKRVGAGITSTSCGDVFVKTNTARSCSLLLYGLWTLLHPLSAPVCVLSSNRKDRESERNREKDREREKEREREWGRDKRVRVVYFRAYEFCDTCAAVARVSYTEKETKRVRGGRSFWALWRLQLFWPAKKKCETEREIERERRDRVRAWL